MTNNDITSLIILRDKFLNGQLTSTQFAWEMKGRMQEIIRYCQKGIDAEREKLYPTNLEQEDNPDGIDFTDLKKLDTLLRSSSTLPSLTSSQKTND